MNIKEAKTQIENAMKAYFTKDKFGNFVIPIEKQRPIFVMGPPGIGKTAIMEQIAQELNVGIVSYSMTHHTRQSALGLPFIVTKNYGGEEYSVSEYTMSEIIASVYEMIEKTGKQEGILFLDEINCVSETLAPSMLQFLQYKIFGRHRVPDGWIVVTAGNPPEYNNSVREFDIVTWDRLKRVDVEPNYDVWKEFAYKSGVHASIITYLDIKKDNFYKIETTVDGKTFVTARGWSDLSDMIKLYEQNNIVVDEQLVLQYLQNKKIAKDFAIYYDLYNKYKSDYQINEILNGNFTDTIKNRAKKAKFDERLSLLGLLLDSISGDLHGVYRENNIHKELQSILKKVKSEFSSSKTDITKLLEKYSDEKKQELKIGEQSNQLSQDNIFNLNSIIEKLEEWKEILEKETNIGNEETLKLLKNNLGKQSKALKTFIEETKEKLSNAFHFCEEVFGDGQELLILVTELTINYYGVNFISQHGCDEYFKHNKELLFYERQKEIIQELEDIEE